MKEIDGKVYICEEEFDRAVSVVSKNFTNDALEDGKDGMTAMIIGMTGMMFAAELNRVLFKGEID